jgi:hypothetical protein
MRNSVYFGGARASDKGRMSWIVCEVERVGMAFRVLCSKVELHGGDGRTSGHFRGASGAFKELLPTVVADLQDSAESRALHLSCGY